jgi:tRNA A58 N-methylase Trm61
LRLLLLVALAQPPQVEIQAPYVRTPPEAVAAMLKLAAVDSRDIVYDLGSGDGRIVIAAARKFGARGVGIEVHPERVAEARRNALQAGVARRTEFRLGDIFEADLREATVVTMFLLADLNRKLRPKLQAELPPGARVVSYCFDMGGWKPARTIDAGACKIHLWIVPQR